LIAVVALLTLTLQDFDKYFIIYAFCVLNLEIFLKLLCLEIRFKIQFIASQNTEKFIKGHQFNGKLRIDSFQKTRH